MNGAEAGSLSILTAGKELTATRKANRKRGKSKELTIKFFALLIAYSSPTFCLIALKLFPIFACPVHVSALISQQSTVDNDSLPGNHNEKVENEVMYDCRLRCLEFAVRRPMQNIEMPWSLRQMARPPNTDNLEQSAGASS